MPPRKAIVLWGPIIPTPLFLFIILVFEVVKAASLPLVTFYAAGYIIYRAVEYYEQDFIATQ